MRYTIAVLRLLSSSSITNPILFELFDGGATEINAAVDVVNESLPSLQTVEMWLQSVGVQPRRTFVHHLPTGLHHVGVVLLMTFHVVLQNLSYTHTHTAIDTLLSHNKTTTYPVMCLFPLSVALCDHNPPTLQTDRQTDGQTSCCSTSETCYARQQYVALKTDKVTKCTSDNASMILTTF